MQDINQKEEKIKDLFSLEIEPTVFSNIYSFTIKYNIFFLEHSLEKCVKGEVPFDMFKYYCRELLAHINSGSIKVEIYDEILRHDVLIKDILEGFNIGELKDEDLEMCLDDVKTKIEFLDKPYNQRVFLSADQDCYLDFFEDFKRKRDPRYDRRLFCDLLDHKISVGHPYAYLTKLHYILESNYLTNYEYDYKLARQLCFDFLESKYVDNNLDLLPELYYYLGLAFYLDESVVSRFENAYKYFNMASLAGIRKATYYLARMYINQEYVEGEVLYGVKILESEIATLMERFQIVNAEILYKRAQFISDYYHNLYQKSKELDDLTKAFSYNLTARYMLSILDKDYADYMYSNEAKELNEKNDFYQSNKDFLCLKSLNGIKKLNINYLIFHILRYRPETISMSITNLIYSYKITLKPCLNKSDSFLLYLPEYNYIKLVSKLEFIVDNGNSIATMLPNVDNDIIVKVENGPHKLSFYNSYDELVGVVYYEDIYLNIGKYLF